MVRDYSDSVLLSSSIPCPVTIRAMFLPLGEAVSVTGGTSGPTFVRPPAVQPRPNLRRTSVSA